MTPRKPVSAGRKLRRELDKTLREASKDGEKWEWDSREVALLALIESQADTIEKLDQTITEDGLTATGSTGQTRLHPAVTEVRLARSALAKLLAQLQLPEDAAAGGSQLSAKSRQHQKAADSRWNRQRWQAKKS
ncbi:hypothetical protein [Rhodococcus sp. ARP2]|uniref:hypothetical protein n=1 Tax=Rhodococcus sp. ARP2 TaxID=1661385 RepID=UPI00069E6B28|nr:hypothetical protein [Rhodococcus sp. ARP2]